MVACGSSHADDYGPDGILETLKHLDRAGLVHAGSGRNLAEARSPAFQDTPRGRVALVAASAEHSDSARAGEQRTDTTGYPGVNGLRHRTEYEVDGPTFTALREVSRTLGWEAELARQRQHGTAAVADDASYNFLGRTIRRSDAFATRTYPHHLDLENNLRQIRHARANADYVVASFHCHEQGGPSYYTAERRSDVADLADFAVDYAHQAIDAGADIFAAHGPQVGLGVEIYKIVRSSMVSGTSFSSWRQSGTCRTSSTNATTSTPTRHRASSCRLDTPTTPEGTQRTR